MTQRELLRDRSAEARAEHVRALDTGRVENGQRVTGHLRSRVRPRRLVAVADAAVVEDEHAETLREQRDDRLPAPAAVAETLDEQQRRPVAVRLPRDADALRVGDHAVS